MSNNCAGVLVMLQVRALANGLVPGVLAAHMRVLMGSRPEGHIVANNLPNPA